MGTTFAAQQAKRDDAEPHHDWRECESCSGEGVTWEAWSKATYAAERLAIGVQSPERTAFIHHARSGIIAAMLDHAHDRFECVPCEGAGKIKTAHC